MPDEELTYAGKTPAEAASLFTSLEVEPTASLYLEYTLDSICGCLIGVLLLEKLGSVEAVRAARAEADSYADLFADTFGITAGEAVGLSRGFAGPSTDPDVFPPGPRRDAVNFALTVHDLVFPGEY